MSLTSFAPGGEAAGVDHGDGESCCGSARKNRVGDYSGFKEITACNTLVIKIMLEDVSTCGAETSMTPQTLGFKLNLAEERKRRLLCASLPRANKGSTPTLLWA